MANLIDRYKVKAIVIISVVSVVVIVITSGVSATQQYISDVKNSITETYEAKIKLIEGKEDQKINALKQDILDRLKQCESGSMTLDDAPMILDSNHEMSIGLYMFQRDTVIYYWEKFYGEKITRKTAVEIALSEKARDLAEKIIFDETGGIFNWANCARRENLVAEITVIKKLQ